MGKCHQQPQCGENNDVLSEIQTNLPLTSPEHQKYNKSAQPVKTSAGPHPATCEQPLNILLLESIHPDAVEMLESAGEVRLTAGNPLAEIIDSHAVITRGRGRVTREAIMAARNLRCIARCGSGTDNIDVATATGRGIPVIYSPAGTTVAVAEHTLMLMLAVSRRLTLLDREVRAGNWEIRNRTSLNTELAGKKLGIVGLGRIGRRVAELGAAFGMNVVYWSRSSSDAGFRAVAIDELFAEADFVSICLSLGDQTRGLVDRRLISLMKPGAYLINTSRGEIVDETALIDALRENRIAGAGLDVLAEEPPPADHPLLSMPNVVITPHVAIWTDVTYRNMCVEVAGQVINVLNGLEIDEQNLRNKVQSIKYKV